MIKVSGRVFVALRKEKSVSASPLYHAVTPYCRLALCGNEPGASSQWTEPPAGLVTCPACLDRLSRLARPGRAGAISRRPLLAAPPPG